ncbi:MAG TPA: hypothetical protein VGN97_22540 [Mesorhizobium sp.]|jgi:hypothetical protein|nr:hypothetical protein [Mesorhizobium sp.]
MPEHSFRKTAPAWAAAALCLAIFNVAKGVRPPSNWAATQAQIDYSLGVIKRGLFGQIGRWLGLEIGRYEVFVGVSAGGLLAFLAALATFCWRFRVFGDRTSSLLALAFSASFAMACFAHLVGYFDLLLGAMALAVLCLPPGARPFAALLGGCLGVLVHEMYLFVFLPLTLLPVALAAIERAASLRRAVGRLMLVALLAVPALSIVLALALRPPLDPQQALHLQEFVASRTDFPVRPDFFLVFERSSQANLEIMAGLFSERDFLMRQVSTAFEILPLVALFAWAAWLRLSSVAPAWRRTLAACLTAGAGLSPLIMHGLGWDVLRWNALALLTSAAAYFVLDRRPANHPSQESAGLQARAIQVLAALSIPPSLLFSYGFMHWYWPFKGLHEVLRSLQEGAWVAPEL